LLKNYKKSKVKIFLRSVYRNKTFLEQAEQNKNNSALAYNFKASQIHQKNLQKSINEQLATLEQ
jgi:hypothetical protein